MSETPVYYDIYKPDSTCDTMADTELHTLRADLEELERRLIPLLVTVQRALGKEPTVMTRDARRGR